MTPRRGPDLPYSIVAGVTPWKSRWLVASAKIAGATFAPEEPRLYGSFGEILSESPAYSQLVVNAPIGYVDKPGSGVRTCDQNARALLGRRGSTVQNAPSRAAIQDLTHQIKDRLDAVSTALLPRYREVAAEMSPYRQRVVYEGHPELSFYQLNGDVPLRWSKNTETGRIERRVLLEKRIPDIDKILDSTFGRVPGKYLMDGSALLWTARRVFGRAAIRIPFEAEWDSEGLRIEMVY